MSKAYSKTRRAGATASDDALHEAAREAVKAAIDADHAPDPLFRPVVSRLVSAYTSAAKRHGPLIERAIGDALEAAGCAVFRNLGLPVPQGALELAESHENALTPKRQIRFVEGKIASFVDVDVLAIDEEPQTFERSATPRPRRCRWKASVPGQGRARPHGSPRRGYAAVAVHPFARNQRRNPAASDSDGVCAGPVPQVPDRGGPARRGVYILLRLPRPRRLGGRRTRRGCAAQQQGPKCLVAGFRTPRISRNFGPFSSVAEDPGPPATLSKKNP